MTRRLRVEADGGSRGNPGPAGYGAVVRDAATGEVLAEVAAGIGRATNNVAEYRGLIAGLRAAADLAPDEVEVAMDSKLVVEQMAGRWQVKHPDMRTLRREAAEAVAALGVPITYRHIPRLQNSHADRLANEAMDAAALGAVWSPPPPLSRDDQELVAAAEGSPTTTSSWSSGRGTAPANRLSGWMSGPAPPCTTVLLRHGQTPLSVDRRFSGLGEAALTSLGREQAAAAAARLARGGTAFTALYTSPLGRAQETAQAVAAATGLAPVIDERLRETDFGDWEGSTFAEVKARWAGELAAWLADPEVAPPGGESFAATTLRVQAARDDITARHPGEQVVVVSHVTPIKSLLRLALDAPASVLYRLHLDLASLSVVDWYADGLAVVRSANDAAHLDPA